jgi:hypothetical protein
MRHDLRKDDRMRREALRKRCHADIPIGAAPASLPSSSITKMARQS